VNVVAHTHGLVAAPTPTGVAGSKSRHSGRHMGASRHARQGEQQHDGKPGHLEGR